MKRAAASGEIPTPRRSQPNRCCRRSGAATSGGTGDIPCNSSTGFAAQCDVTARRWWHEGWFTLELRRSARRADQWNSCTIAGNQVQRLCRVVRRGPRLTHVPSKLWSLQQFGCRCQRAGDGTITSAGRTQPISAGALNVRISDTVPTSAHFLLYNQALAYIANCESRISNCWVDGLITSYCWLPDVSTAFPRFRKLHTSTVIVHETASVGTHVLDAVHKSARRALEQSQAELTN